MIDADHTFSSSAWLAMYSLFDIFKIGIGPSSSHTVGPMLAAGTFARRLQAGGQLSETHSVRVRLYGSLALTGLGHATDRAVIGGLCGFEPATVPLDEFKQATDRAQELHRVRLAGQRDIAFIPAEHIEFYGSDFLPHHPNGLTFIASDTKGRDLLAKTYYSIGGGFIVDDDHVRSADAPMPVGEAVPEPSDPTVAYPFRSARQLLAMCESEGLTIAELTFANELFWRSSEEIENGIDRIWSVMRESVETGCRCTGVLPGGLKIKRRAPEISQQLMRSESDDPLRGNDWLSLYALAVNEENAAGGRVVTAPTNGAAGVIPAVIAYCEKFVAGFDSMAVREFLLTSTAIGLLYKMNASFSAAEMGCQGEVGVACSMAAAGFAAVLGGTPRQIENAAEIGMEHNLGLTCDPIKGLVQVPCIERNTMGAVKAVNAARLAVLYGDGHHHVSLDGVIETMRQTGVDMQSKYKETSLGGLAVNVTEC